MRFLFILLLLILSTTVISAPSDFTTTGKVGIATTNPTQEVDVVGSIRLDSQEYADKRTQLTAGNPNGRITGEDMDSIASLSVSGTIANIADVSMSPSGTTLYLIDANADGSGGDSVAQYNCSSAWNVSSCSYSDEFTISETLLSEGIYVRPDGKSFYIASPEFGGGKVRQYSCNTAWDISSCSYDSKSLTSPNRVNYNTWLKPDGTKVYLLDNDNSTITQWSCSTPWEIDTCTYDGVERTYSGVQRGIDISSDGRYLFTSEGGGPVDFYICDEPWEINTCALEATGTGGQRGISLSPDLNYMIAGRGTTIETFTLPIATDGDVGVGVADPTVEFDVDGAIVQRQGHFYAYDNAGGTSIGTSWTDITWDTEVREGDIYTHATDSASIDINEAGWYLITYECTMDTSTSTRNTVDHRLLADGTEIGGTRRSSYHRLASDGEDTAKTTTLHQVLGSSDTIKAQAIADESSSITTVADGCRIIITRK